MKIGIEIVKKAMKKSQLTKSITEGEVLGMNATVHEVRGGAHSLAVVFDHNYKETYIAAQGKVLRAILDAKKKEIIRARRKAWIETARAERKAQIDAESPSPRPSPLKGEGDKV